MQTVILAAGQGTRMRPLTDTIRKPMLPVAGRPLVAHVADAAVSAGATRLIFVVPHALSAVREHFGERYASVPVAYAVQATQEGTADALDAARSELAEAPFVVLNGDLLLDARDLEPLYAGDPAVGTTRVEDPREYGVVELSADETTVQRVIEKPSDPPSNLANAGAYALPAAALASLGALSPSARGEYELTDLLNVVAAEHPVEAVRFDRWLDVGRPWELLAANEWKLPEVEPERLGTISDDAELAGPVRVEAGATVREGVTIEGPALIQERAEVGPNAYVRGTTLVGPDAKIGHAVEVKNSVLFSGATVGHQSYVGDSLLGPDVNFGAGTNVANLRHDDEPIRTVVDGEVVSTGRRKFGVVVGPGAKTGIDTSLNAGVVLAGGETTLPGETLLKTRL